MLKSWKLEVGWEAGDEIRSSNSGPVFRWGEYGKSRIWAADGCVYVCISTTPSMRKRTKRRRRARWTGVIYVVFYTAFGLDVNLTATVPCRHLSDHTTSTV